MCWINTTPWATAQKVFLCGLCKVDGPGIGDVILAIIAKICSSLYARFILLSLRNRSLRLTCALTDLKKGRKVLLLVAQAQWDLCWHELVPSDVTWSTQTTSYSINKSHSLALLQAPLGTIWSHQLTSEILVLFVYLQFYFLLPESRSITRMTRPGPFPLQHLCLLGQLCSLFVDKDITFVILRPGTNWEDAWYI